MTQRPKRYRDVLALLKQLARTPDVSIEALRGLLSGFGPGPYGQADMQKVFEVARSNGWEISIDVEADDQTSTYDTLEACKTEIRRLHTQARMIQDELKTLRRNQDVANKRGAELSDKRRAQMTAANVKSVDEAFERLTEARTALRALLHEAVWDADSDRAAFDRAYAIAQDVIAKAPAPAVTHESSRPCGCDPGENYTCEQHRGEAVRP